MGNQDKRKAIIEVLAKLIGNEPADLVLDDTLDESGLESLDLFQLPMELEHKADELIEAGQVSLFPDEMVSLKQELTEQWVKHSDTITLNQFISSVITGRLPSTKTEGPVSASKKRPGPPKK